MLARRVSSVDAHLQAELEAVTERAPAVAVPELSPALDMASSVGNRGMSQVISRMSDGEGILPSGIAHPVVESTIAAARGAGSPLEPALAQQFGSVLGRSVGDVRVHTDETAASLTRAVSARAFATGRDIFFAAGEYRPHTPQGRELIAHEVAHADQQLGAPMSGPLVVSNPGEPLELAADQTAGELLG
jgi:Domain of unknown function (DUF4157)